MSSPTAVVRLTEPAIEDLRRLLRKDPQIVRQMLKKMLLLERNPLAGEALLGGLIGFRKLVVGDNHWRIVWRAGRDADGRVTVEIAEVWAAGARSDAEVYEEVSQRLAAMPEGATTRALNDVLGLLGSAGRQIYAAPEPVGEGLPAWLVDRLVGTAGLRPEAVASMSLEEGVDAWTAFMSRPR